MAGLTPFDFAARVAHLPYAHKGVWPGELYLFLSCCLAAGVTLILESGVKHGMSTAMLDAAFDGPVFSVDRQFHVEPPRRGMFVAGDAMVEIPRLIAAHARETIGLLIDGPKGDGALALKAAAFHAPHVAVVGIHDVEARGDAARHSHDEDYAATAARLNASVPEPYASKYPLGGPGLAVWTRRAA